MKKFLIAAAAGLLLFGGQVGAEAAPADLNANVQTQKMSAWPRIRDSLLGRDHNRHHRDYRDHRDHHYGYHDDHHRHGHGYGAPPPPPRHR